jgi:hypothetical protein
MAKATTTAQQVADYEAAVLMAIKTYNKVK